MSGMEGNGGYPIYSASKAALNMYAKLIAKKRNCYVICPGATDTKMRQRLGLSKGQSPEVVAEAVEYIMQGRYNSGDIIKVKNGKIYDS